MDKKELAVNLAIVCILVVSILAITIIAIRTTAIALDADEYDCNLLYCSFKKTIKEADCYQNGEPINCSEIIDKYDEKSLEYHG